MKKLSHAYYLLIAACCLLLSPYSCFAQEVEMAEQLRSSGKIYVVVAVISVIFIGLVIYLFSIDRKISKIEKEIEKK